MATDWKAEADRILSGRKPHELVRQDRTFTAHEILEAVCERRGVRVDDVISKCSPSSKPAPSSAALPAN